MALLLLQYGTWLLLAIGVALTLAVLWTVLAAVRARRAAYFGLRQQAIHQLRLRTVVTFGVLIAFVVLAITINSQPAAPAPATTPVAVISTPTPIPPPPTSPPTRLPSSTPSPTSAATATAEPALLPTSTSSPTATLTATVPAVLLTPLPAAASPAPNAKLTFTTFASVLDSNNNPVDSGQVFPVGTRRVRIFFRAVNISNGVTWSVLCHKDNKLVDSFAGPWQWGARAQTARAFCNIDGSAGTYVVSAYLGLIKQFEMTFSVIAATDTPTPEPVATQTPAS
jgi:hypothetical protein